MGNLKLIDRKDIEIANNILDDLNKTGESKVSFSELTPVALLLIHHSMKEFNHNHVHFTKIILSYNDRIIPIMPFDMDYMNLFPENGKYWTQMYGWCHSSLDAEEGFVRIPGMVFSCGERCFSTPEMEELISSEYKFKPMKPNTFIDFCWNELYKEQSLIKFTMNNDHVMTHIELVFHGSEDKLKITR